MQGLTRYRQVVCGTWAARTCAGDAAATWAAVQAGRHRLRLLPPHGWTGLLDERPWRDDMLELLQPLAAACLPAGMDLPALCLGVSKGDLAALRDLLAGSPGALHRWPTGSITPRLAARLGLSGFLGGSAVAACSTGLYALLAAADHIERDETTRALACSGDAAVDPLLMPAYRRMGVLCGERLPSAFDGAGTGFAAAEGAAAIGLHAGDGPWRLLAGVRLGDAMHETRCEDPRVLRQCLDALWSALPEPDLIVAHATGTAVGDRFEQAALQAGPWAATRPVLCKPIIGHCLGASGLVELAAALCSPARRIWKLSLGFGGHIAAVAVERA